MPLSLWWKSRSNTNRLVELTLTCWFSSSRFLFSQNTAIITKMANDSFFIAPKPQKRKRVQTQSSKTNDAKVKDAPKKRVVAQEDEDAAPIDDYEDLDLRHSSAAEDSDDDQDENTRETAQEKRIRLAKQYIAGVEKSVREKQREGFDAADLDRDLIAERLQLDALESQGKLKRFVAKKVSF